MRTTRCAHARGLALVVVLWLVAALTILVTAQVATMRADLRGGHNQRLFAEHEALGDAAIRLVAIDLLDNPFPEIPLELAVQVEGVTLAVRVVPSSAYIDLNLASQELLTDLLIYGAGLDQHSAALLAQRIVDWRDADDEPLPGGAENPDYERQNKPYRTRSGPFESIEDLLQVLGIGLDVYDRLRGLVTIHGTSASVDPRYAPEGVLQVLARGNLAAVSAVMASRAAGSPLLDMTGLTPEFVAAMSSRRYRFEALQVRDGLRLSRVRWIELGSGRRDFRPGGAQKLSVAPWTEIAAEPVSATPAMESADGV